MRRALAAGLLSWALAAHAQAPPETPPPADTQPTAPSPQRESAPNPAAAGEAPAAETPGTPSPAAERPRALPAAPKAAAGKASAATPPVEGSTRDAEVAALRAEVNRLQSELDSERAAAVPPPEDTPSAAPAVRSPWGWLAATTLLALAAGFALGWRLLDRRIRRKYGGLRIY